jgi:hypothetical protein
VKSLVLIFLTVFSTLALAMPDQVILFRHGEEPHGEEGTELSKHGRARAAALHEIFDRYPDLKKPTAMFSMKPKSERHSIRAIQTMIPISELLKVELQIPYKFDEFPMLINQLRNDRNLDGKAVMICWGHDELKPFAKALGAKHVKDWDGKVFDKLWILTFKEGEFQSMEERDQDLSIDQKSGNKGKKDDQKHDKKDEDKDRKKKGGKRD